MFEYIAMVATVRDLQQRINALQRPDVEMRGVEVLPQLKKLLPTGNLKRGTQVSLQGSLRLALAFAAQASRAGQWCGVVGVPSLNYEAGAELGINLERFILVPKAL